MVVGQEALERQHGRGILNGEDVCRNRCGFTRGNSVKNIIQGGLPFPRDQGEGSVGMPRVIGKRIGQAALRDHFLVGWRLARKIEVAAHDHPGVFRLSMN